MKNKLLIAIIMVAIGAAISGMVFFRSVAFQQASLGSLIGKTSKSPQFAVPPDAVSQ